DSGSVREACALYGGKGEYLNCISYMTRERSKPCPKSIITFSSPDLLMLIQVPNKSRILKLKEGA
ncbi:MAG: hypothetical protein QUS12_15110, partial [Methanosarcina sp.]|nr:hypothetical protein [Methanosarcina sp.]